ncbi:MAG: asparaginase [Thermodesulfobacteriota bacterium]|nr:asparaginase [Thermodesulfobacteriota bacterium]
MKQSRINSKKIDTEKTASPVLVTVTRGGHLESFHRGSIVIANARGNIIDALGNPNFPTFMRSCAKPIQALPIVESGATETFSFTDAELALFCGSLNGQDFQIDILQSILTKIGLNENNLKCGIHRPSHRATAESMRKDGLTTTQLHNNCAGKHTCMLALCVHHKYPIDTYLEVNHPVQKMILNTVAKMCDIEAQEVKIGIDGCGVPVFSVPLKNIAVSYAKLAAPEASNETTQRKEAIKRLTQSLVQYPEMIAGDERICTDIMRIAHGRVLAKTGADGSYAMGLLEKGLGVGIKVDDGSTRALNPIVIDSLVKMGIITESEKDSLKAYYNPVISNYRKEEVGRISTTFSLKHV